MKDAERKPIYAVKAASIMYHLMGYAHHVRIMDADTRPGQIPAIDYQAGIYAAMVNYDEDGQPYPLLEGTPAATVSAEGPQEVNAGDVLFMRMSTFLSKKKTRPSQTQMEQANFLKNLNKIATALSEIKEDLESPEVNKEGKVTDIERRKT